MDTIIQNQRLPKISIINVDRLKSLESLKDETLSIPLTEGRTRLSTDASYGSKSMRQSLFFDLTTANTSTYTDRDNSFRNNPEEGSKFKKLQLKSQVSSIGSPIFKRNLSFKSFSGNSSPFSKTSHESLSWMRVGKIYGDKTDEEKEEAEEDKRIWKKFHDSADLRPKDNQNQKLYGKKSRHAYYQHYKEIDKVQDQNTFFSVEGSAFTQMILSAKKNVLIPLKTGMIRPKESKKLLAIKNMRLGDKYAEVVAAGLVDVQTIDAFELGNNRFGPSKGSYQLVSQAMKSAKILDLTNNQIGNSVCETIACSITSKTCKLEVLKLGSNKLGDTAIKMLLEVIVKNQHLKILDISNNQITDAVSEKLKTSIQKSVLYELYIGWNNLNSIGGKALFSALAENDSLKVLDVCKINTIALFQNLGSRGSCFFEICEFMEKNTEMRHLDLSQNYFSSEDCKQIAVSLEKNKTIYGLHFAGNHGHIDSRGFLVFPDTLPSSALQALHRKRKINGIKSQLRTVPRDSNSDDDCCWICDGWNEVEFKWNFGTSGQLKQTDPLFLHLGFEDFKPIYYGKQKDNIKEGFLYYRGMVPLEKLHYYFSSKDSIPFIAQDHLSTQQQTNKQKISGIQPKQMNYMIIQNNEDIFNKFYEVTVSTEPRKRDPEYIPPKKKEIKQKWTFPISLMAKWRIDDEDLLVKCFQFDWDNGKILKIMKNHPEDIPAVRDFLEKRYQLLKNIYKHFASQNPIGDVWAIQKQQFSDLIGLSGIVDGKGIKEADIDIKWTATLAGQEKGNPRNPERGINRYQLMEVFLRIAEEKYILKNSQTTLFSVALTKLWDDHLAGLSSQYNEQKWREERYWNEECDFCLKHHKSLIEHVYHKFSKKKVKPGQNPFVSLEELQAICHLCGLQNDPQFGSGVVNYAFNLAMMTQIDELTQDRIFQMSQVEFYEALARIAEEANLPPLPGILEVGETGYEKQKSLHLSMKLEAFLQLILQCCADSAFRESYSGFQQFSLFALANQKIEMGNDEDNEEEPITEILSP